MAAPTTSSPLTIVHEPGHNGRPWSTDVLIEPTTRHHVEVEAPVWHARDTGVSIERQAHLALVALLRRLRPTTIADAINGLVGHQALTPLKSTQEDGRRWQGRIGMELKRPGYPAAGLVRQLRLQMSARDAIGPDGTLLWVCGTSPPAAVRATADNRCHVMRIARLTDALMREHDPADEEARTLAERVVRLLSTPLGSRDADKRPQPLPAVPRVHRLVLPVALAGQSVLATSTNHICDQPFWINRRVAMEFLRVAAPLLDGRERIHPVADVLAAAHAHGLLRSAPPVPTGEPVLLTGVRTPAAGDQWLWSEVRVKKLLSDVGVAAPRGELPVDVWAERTASRQRVYAAGDVVSVLETTADAGQLLRRLTP
ncbi:MAG: hypothetical protein ABGZ36_14515 [Actinomycetota bacterium]